MFKPAVQTSVTSQIIQRKKQAKFYYDRYTKPLPKLVIGQPVQVKALPQYPHSVLEARNCSFSHTISSQLQHTGRW